jgi:hypothetical protein
LQGRYNAASCRASSVIGEEKYEKRIYTGFGGNCCDDNYAGICGMYGGVGTDAVGGGDPDGVSDNAAV